jgi:phosphatidylinositol-3-phosphatase
MTVRYGCPPLDRGARSADLEPGVVMCDVDNSRAARRASRRRLDRRTLLQSLLASVAGAVLGLHAADAADAPPRWWSSLVWAVFENHGFQQVAALPSHRRLAREGTVFTQYFALTHPSGPNYRAMASGEIWGHDEVIDTFHPTVASMGAAATPPIPTYLYHLIGRIDQKHDPFVDLHAPIAQTRTGLDALRSDLEGGTTALPERCLVYVGWDDDNEMHNGHPERADANLTALMDVLAASSWFATADRNGRYPAFFFCYDEGEYSGDNQVFAAFWGHGVRRGAPSTIRHTHYGFCRTMSDNWRVPVLGEAAREAPIVEPWI